MLKLHNYARAMKLGYQRQLEPQAPSTPIKKEVNMIVIGGCVSVCVSVAHAYTRASHALDNSLTLCVAD